MPSKIPLGTGRGQPSRPSAAAPSTPGGSKIPKPSMIPRVANAKAKIDTGLVRKKPAPKHVRIVEKQDMKPEVVDVSSPITPAALTIHKVKDHEEPQIVKSKTSILKVASQSCPGESPLVLEVIPQKVELWSFSDCEIEPNDEQECMISSKLAARQEELIKMFEFDEEITPEIIIPKVDKDMNVILTNKVQALEAELKDLQQAQTPSNPNIQSSTMRQVSEFGINFLMSPKNPGLENTLSKTPFEEPVGTMQEPPAPEESKPSASTTTTDPMYYSQDDYIKYANSGVDPFFDYPIEHWVPSCGEEDDINENYDTSYMNPRIPDSIQDITAPPIIHETVSDPRLSDDPCVQMELQGRSLISEEQAPHLVDSNIALVDKKSLDDQVCGDNPSIETFQNFQINETASSHGMVCQLRSFNAIIADAQTKTNQENFERMEMEMIDFLEEQASFDDQKMDHDNNGNEDQITMELGVTEINENGENTEVAQQEPIISKIPFMHYDLQLNDENAEVQEPTIWDTSFVHDDLQLDQDNDGESQGDVENGEAGIVDEMLYSESIGEDCAYLHRQLDGLKSGVREMQIWGSVTMYLSATVIVGVLAMENFQAFINSPFPDPEPVSWWSSVVHSIFGKST